MRSLRWAQSNVTGVLIKGNLYTETPGMCAQKKDQFQGWRLTKVSLIIINSYFVVVRVYGTISHVSV